MISKTTSKTAVAPDTHAGNLRKARPTRLATAMLWSMPKKIHSLGTKMKVAMLIAAAAAATMAKRFQKARQRMFG